MMTASKFNRRRSNEEIFKEENVNINLDNADVNADGKVNSTDFSILKRYVMKNIEECHIDKII